jgi:PTS system sucrose-specific IIC component
MNLEQEILNNIGGIENINHIENCMTRLRITPFNTKLINIENLKKIDKVIGVVVSGNQYQIILGPGLASTTKVNIDSLIKENNQINTTFDSKKTKQQIKDKYELSFSNSLKFLSNIFIPILPALIGCGLLLGISNILKNPTIALYIQSNWFENYNNYIALISIFGNAIFSVLAIIVGITTAQTLGGSIAIGATMAAILSSPALANVILFNEKLTPMRGGIISIILVVYLTILLEKRLKKYITGALDLLFTPLLLILIMGICAVILIQPFGGYISNLISFATLWSLDNGGIFTGFLLAGLFLPLVMTGLHQALLPIHIQLIQDTGYTLLLPVFAMAGAGQVGASMAVYIKTKNKKLKSIIKTALPVGIMGIGEPLIYGVTLPLGRPFIGACIGGAFGGAIVSFLKIGAISLGISGLPMLLVVNKALLYLLAVITAYICGFIATYILGFKDINN